MFILYYFVKYQALKIIHWKGEVWIGEVGGIEEGVLTVTSSPHLYAGFFGSKSSMLF